MALKETLEKSELPAKKFRYYKALEKKAYKEFSKLNGEDLKRFIEAVEERKA